MEHDEEIEEAGLIEIRPKISPIENKKLLAIRNALRKVLSKKAVARLVIAYGVEHSAEFLAWYGKCAAEEVAKVGED